MLLRFLTCKFCWPTSKNYSYQPGQNDYNYFLPMSNLRIQNMHLGSQDKSWEIWGRKILPVTRSKQLSTNDLGRLTPYWCFWILFKHMLLLVSSSKYKISAISIYKTSNGKIFSIHVVMKLQNDNKDRKLPNHKNKAICYDSSCCQFHLVAQKPPTLWKKQKENGLTSKRLISNYLWFCNHRCIQFNFPKYWKRLQWSQCI